MGKWFSWSITAISITQVTHWNQYSLASSYKPNIITNWFPFFFLIGLAKILKKYDKRTGGLLRLLFIQNVLKQPFFTTELVSKLIKECENTIAEVFPVEEKEEERKKERKEPITVTGEGIFRNTVAALLTMKEIRSGSSTQSHFSLPPLNLPDSEVIQSLQLNSPIPIL